MGYVSSKKNNLQQLPAYQAYLAGPVLPEQWGSVAVENVDFYDLKGDVIRAFIRNFCRITRK